MNSGRATCVMALSALRARAAVPVLARASLRALSSISDSRTDRLQGFSGPTVWHEFTPLANELKGERGLEPLRALYALTPFLG